MPDSIGYRWLAERYAVVAVQPFRTTSTIGKSRSTVRENGYVHEQYPPAARPAASLVGHLTFALKHEGVHLEFLARLFDVVPAAELEAWVAAEPTGQYARRAGFFYEYLTGRLLAVPDTVAGNYVTALDEERYLTAARAINCPRWRVRDNLPGSREFCPMVLRTPAVQQAEAYVCADHLADLEAEFGADILQRSAVWLTVKESRASFAIEREERHVDRVRRFAAAMERWCGRHEAPLSDAALQALQAEILGPRATRYGIRRSPVFVGEVDGFREVVHYDVLRRDGAVPEPFILPVSATITSSVIKRRGYDQVLELFSQPFMRRYTDAWRFGPELRAEDGVRYNLQFDRYADALHAWRYPDLTDHVEYLADTVRVTIE